MVAGKAKAFAIVSRPEAHRYLAKNGWTDHDLSSDGVRAKFANDFQLDAIIWGKVSVTQGVVVVDLSARTPDWNKLFQAQHQETLDVGYQADLEATQAGVEYFFPGLDGVTVPMCSSCPIPMIPDSLRDTRIQGNVLLSVLITADGSVGDIRVSKSIAADLDRAAIPVVRTWRFKPSHDADGDTVPVRIPVEVTFRRY